MAEATFSLDLHVLSPPLTFALSQDQTLHRKFEPTLHRLIAPHPGGREHPTWNGFLLTKPISIEWLAIQFSETETAAFRRRPQRLSSSGMLLIRGSPLVVNTDAKKIFESTIRLITSRPR